MTNRSRRVVAVLGAVALTVPSAAAAAPGKGKGPAKSDGASQVRTTGEEAGAKGKAKGKGKAKKVKLATYVVKGVYAGAGRVDVTGGNAHARRAGLIGEEVAFDFGKAKLVVADTDGDDRVTVKDLQAGDKLTVQLKLPRSLGAGPHVARKVVDRTHPPVDDDSETETENETETETEAPTPDEA